MKSLKTLFLAAVFTVMPFFAFADVFDITINADGYGNTYYQSFNTLEDMIDKLDAEEIASHFVGYDEENTGASVTMNFRGLPITAEFVTNSSTLNVRIAAIDLDLTFSGSDRDDSVDQLQDWFEKDGGDALTRLQQALVEETATDPIAGNPTSLMSRMVAMDFDAAFRSDSVIEINTPSGSSAPELNANMISVFARYSNYTANGVRSKEYALPLAYTIRFNGSKNTLAIRMPISMVDVEGSQAGNLGLGLALGYHINDDWKITPAVGYGAVGSIDLGSVGQIVSGSVTSSYTFHIKGYDLNMGNMAGYYQTIPFKYGDYDFDPDIQNTVVRNGLNLVIPVKKESGLSFDVFATDTRYFGSELYIDKYNEVGFSFGYDKGKTKETAKGLKSIHKRLRAGLTYMFAEDAHGYTVNGGYSF